MIQKTILVVDDEENILELIRFNLAKEGYNVIGVTTGEEAVEQAKTKSPDLILLDLMLPGIDGFDVCRALKSTTSTKHIPIIMLTAKGEDVDTVSGLELGAEDYIVKPFSPKVLLARIRTVLRRETPERSGTREHSDKLALHNLSIHPGRHEVLVGKKSVDLSKSEFRLLELLVSRPGWVFSRPDLARAVYGKDESIPDRAIDIQMVGLRRKLGSAGKFVQTVRGVGYRIRA